MKANCKLIFFLQQNILRQFFSGREGCDIRVFFVQIGRCMIPLNAIILFLFFLLFKKKIFYFIAFVFMPKNE